MLSAFKRKSPSSSHSLDELRARIDELDQQLFSLLKQRGELVFAVGEYKRERNLPAYDPSREDAIRKKVRTAAMLDHSLPPHELEILFMALVEKYRYLEGCHMRRASAKALFPDAHLDFSQPQHVILWGFGLLGASFYLALNEMLPHWRFEVVDPFLDPQAFEDWQRSHQLRNIRRIDRKEIVDANIYVLGASVEINAQHLSEHSFAEGSLVIDLGSTKTEMQKMYLQNKMAGRFHYVGGHPLAGKETSGFENADVTLFYNKVFCWISPRDALLDAKVSNSCNALALCLGAEPFWTAAETHDQAMAWNSHLPQVLSCVLASQLAEKSFSRESELFPGVMRELLRISGSSVSIWRSIFATNKNHLKSALKELIPQLTKLQKDLEDTNGESRIWDELFQKSNSFYQNFRNLKK